MNFSSLIIGILLILAIFNVGESLTKKIFISKWLIVGILGITFILSFFGSINIQNFSFSLAGFVIPLLISFFFIFRIKDISSLVRTGICILLVTTFVIIYNAIGFYSFEFKFLQPYLILAIALGLVSFLICNTQSNVFLSLFIGTILGQVIFTASQNSTYGYSNIFLGSEQSLAILFVGLSISLLTQYFARKLRIIRKRRERRNRMQES